ncbi:MAG TPA: hypothetical protein PLZ76_06810, partial [Bacillota bacterium]|nr:hypothetical protein [Bacillota bacterium]
MIIPMKKAVLVALKEDKDALLVSLQRSGEMMLVPPREDLVAETDAQREEALLQRAEKSLQLLKKMTDKKDKTRAEHSGMDAETMLSAVESAADEIQTRQAEIQSLREKVAFWMPWAEMEEVLNSLEGTSDALFKTGTIDLRRSEEFRMLVEGLGGEFRTYGKTEHGLAVL